MFHEYFPSIMSKMLVLTKITKVVVLILDVYAYLDYAKHPMDQVIQRFHYYKFTIMAALKAIGVPLSKVHFVQESTYETTPQFIQDQWKLCTIVPLQDIKDAGETGFNPKVLSPMLCPGLQTLAEEHLNVDFQFGGADQVCSIV
jgi:tyrosyl-tRNA synthetase